MSKILTQAQAEAVYSAMCALEAVHMRACKLEFGKAIVDAYRDGTIRVVGVGVVDDEYYVDQDAFAAAYGITA